MERNWPQKYKLMSHEQKIAVYCGYYQRRVDSIASLISTTDQKHIGIYQKTLFASVLSALARGYLGSSQQKDKVNFIKTIEDCADWEDTKRVSSVQLHLYLEKRKKRNVCEDACFEILEPMVNKKINSKGLVSISDFDKPFAYWERIVRGNNGDEKQIEKMIHPFRLQNLLYDYRCFLAHELRQPSYEVDESGVINACYVWNYKEDDFGQESGQYELVFPLQLFETLCRNVLTNLSKTFADGTDPYAAYYFSRLWNTRLLKEND